MFKSYANLRLGLKISLGMIAVQILSLVNGIMIGHQQWSLNSVLWLLVTIAVSTALGYLVTGNISKSINEIIHDLTLMSSKVTEAAQQLTHTGNQLTEGTSKQAASIQETSSTLEESASMLHQTTQNTKQAAILAKQAKDAASQGNIDMHKMLGSMDELKKSSTEISKIIKVIDEIAFQTNILSLNAAVEAARAGEAGKGFAVVAEEVRHLAHRSAQAAKDTAVIIESNIQLSEQGIKISAEVNESLLAINDEANKVSELLDEISTASQEQEIGINQINQAISQMEYVVQSNASTAQESASSAELLSTYSDNMKEIINALVGLIKGVINNHSTQPSVRRPVSAVGSSSKKIRSSGERRSATIHNKSNLAGAKVVNPEDIIPLGDF